MHPVGWQTGVAGLVGGPAEVLAGVGSAKCGKIAEAGLAEFAEVTADCRQVVELHSTEAVTIALG